MKRSVLLNIIKKSSLFLGLIFITQCNVIKLNHEEDAQNQQRQCRKITKVGYAKVHKVGLYLVEQPLYS